MKFCIKTMWVQMTADSNSVPFIAKHLHHLEHCLFRQRLKVCHIFDTRTMSVYDVTIRRWFRVSIIFNPNRLVERANGVFEWNLQVRFEKLIKLGGRLKRCLSCELYFHTIDAAVECNGIIVNILLYYEEPRADEMLPTPASII